MEEMALLSEFPHMHGDELTLQNMVLAAWCCGGWMLENSGKKQPEKNWKLKTAINIMCENGLLKGQMQKKIENFKQDY